MRLTVITAPATEPIMLDEAKLHCRVDLDNDDALIERLIAAAREDVEIKKKRALITQTLELRLDDWPCMRLDRVIDIPRPPLQSVTSVKYLDEDGDERTLDADTYTVSTGTPGRVVLNETESWPTLGSYPDAVRVRFVAGYGDADDVRSQTKAWILLRVAHLYKFRESAISGTIVSSVPFLDNLLSGEEWGHYA